MLQRALVLMVGVCVVACSDGADPPFAPDAGTSDALVSADGQCGPNLEAHGTACVPIMDHCAEDEVPLPGGGCKKVGVEECKLEGRMGLRDPQTGACQLLGVAICEIEGRAGLFSESEARCVAVGPRAVAEAACPADELAFPGSGGCVALNDCGQGPWGNVTLRAESLFVLASAFGSPDADGSQAHPFSTLAQALDVAGQGAHIVVGEGVYPENVLVDKDVTIDGRCAQKVRIVPVTRSGFEISAGKIGITGLTVQAPAAGVIVRGVDTELDLRGVTIEGCDDAGLRVSEGATVVAEKSRIWRNGGANVYVYDASLTLRGSAVEQGRAGPVGSGYGVAIESSNGQSAPASLVLEDSLIANHYEAGVVALAAEVTIRGSVIREPKALAIYLGCFLDAAEKGCDSQSAPGSLRVDASRLEGAIGAVASHGVDVQIAQSALGWPSSVVPTEGGQLIEALGFVASGDVALSITRSVLQRAHASGLWAERARIAIAETIVEGEPKPATDAPNARALLIDKGSLALKKSRIGRGPGRGIQSFEADVTIEDSMLVDLQDAGVFCESTAAWPHQLRLQRSLVAAVTSGGVEAFGCRVKIEESVIRDIRAGDTTSAAGGVVVDAPFNTWGQGHDLDRPGQLYLADSRIEGVRGVGIAIYNSPAVIERSVVRGVQCVLRTFKWGELEMGAGVEVFHFDQRRRHPFRLLESVISKNCYLGLHLQNGDAEIEGSVIRNTFAAPQSGEGGAGIDAIAPVENARLKLSRTSIAGNRLTGLWSSGVDVTIEASRFSNTQPVDKATLYLLEDGQLTVATRETFGGDGLSLNTFEPVAELGWGPNTETRVGSLSMRDSVVERSARAGLFTSGVPSDVQRTLFVDNTLPIYHEQTHELSFEQNVYEGGKEQAPVTGLELEPAPPPHALGAGE